MDTTEPTPPPPPPPTPERKPGLLTRLRGGQPLHRSVWTLVLALLLTIATALIAAEAGALLALFGLSWVALLAGALLVLLGTLTLRKLMLPLAVIAAALALPAAAVTLIQRPLDRSAGLLIVQPASVDEVNGKTFRRGVGSIFLDLRRTAWPSSGVIDIRAHTDLGQIVVALPRDRCVATAISSRLTGRHSDAARTILTIAGQRDLVEERSVFGYSSAEWDPPASVGNEAGPTPLIAYGKSHETGRLNRPTSKPAPTLRLNLTGTSPAIVRDYPDDVGPLTPAWALEQQVGDASWPSTVQLPLQPGERVARDGWRHEWTEDQIARRVPQAWTRWERATITAQANQARRAAGACATPTELSTYWSTRRFAQLDGSNSILDETGTPLTVAQAEAALSQGQTLFDDAFTTLTEEQIQERLHKGDLPLAYLISVNARGSVLRHQVQPDGLLAPTKMTPGNPGGAK